MNPPPVPPLRPVAIRGSDLLLILIVSLGSVRLLAGFVAAFSTPGDAEGGGNRMLLATIGLLLVQTAVILGMVRAVVIRQYGLSWADLGLRPVSRRWYARAVLIALFLLPVVGLINVFIPEMAGEPFRNPQIYSIAPAGFSWPGLVAMLVMAGIVAPFAEEVAFRGLLYPWLRERLGVPSAAVASGLCFALLHGVMFLVPALTVIGIVLALVYQRSASLWPAIVTHGVFNSVMILALYGALAAGLELP